ncbi:hypothetical protein Chor_014491 [Crotalus horridus]
MPSGIIFSNGHVWKEQRHIGITSLRKLGLGKKSIEHQIEDAAQTLVETFKKTKGQPFDPSIPVINAVSNIISALSFGHQFAPEDESFQKLIQAIEIIVKFTGSFFHAMFVVFPRLMSYFPGPHKKALAAMELIVSFAKQEIEKHKESSSLHEPQDFIDHYLLQMEKSRNDPNSTYNEENLAQCIVDFFGAGTETTLATLMWALLLLTNHPDIQGERNLGCGNKARLRSEMDLEPPGVEHLVMAANFGTPTHIEPRSWIPIGTKSYSENATLEKVQKEIEEAFSSSASISYQDRKKLPYTNAVIHEMQRLKYVLLVGIPRQSTKDVTMKGYHIPKSTMILPDLRSVLLDPEQWETPEEFNPNHFLDKDGKFMEREEFLPFGIGERICVGEQLARIEIFIFLTNLLRAFSFRLPEGVKELNEAPIVNVTMHPHPYKLCAIPTTA